MKKHIIVSAFLLLSVSLVAKMDEAWTKTYPLEDSAVEIAGDIGVDNVKDSLYVTGLRCIKDEKGTSGTVALRKIDLSGKEVWKQMCDIGVGGIDEKNTVTVDNSDNVYVAGYKYIDRKGKNAWIRKYDQTGSVLWDKVFVNKYDSLDAKITALSVDKADNLYAAGYKYRDGLVRDLWLRKYDPAGKLLWENTYGRSGKLLVENEQGMAVDAAGNAIIAVYQDGEYQDHFLRIKKYGPGGEPLMTLDLPDNAERDRIVSKIALDADGNIYIAGSEAVFYQGRNIFIRKLGPKGLGIWSISYPGVGSQKTSVNGIQVTRNFNVYISATGSGEQNEKKYSWVSKLDKDGNETMAMDYLGYSYGVSFKVRNNGDMYVLGTGSEVLGKAVIWVKKYVPTDIKKQ